MADHLDTWQANMLVTGHELGAEIPAPSPHHRAFLYVFGYSITHRRPSKYLNADHSDVRFLLRGFEVAETDMPAILADSWHADYYEKDFINQKGIASLQELETLLHRYVDDLSVLVNTLKISYPL